MKIIYIDGVKYKYAKLKQLKPILDKAEISIGTECTIGNHVWIYPNTVIGDECRISDECTIHNKCTIGNGCIIDIGCDIWSECIIENNCWLYDNCNIEKNVRICSGSMIGPVSNIIKQTIITESPMHVMGSGLPWVFNAYNGLVQIGCQVKPIAEWRKDYKNKIYNSELNIDLIKQYYDLLKIAEKYHKNMENKPILQPYECRRTWPFN